MKMKVSLQVILLFLATAVTSYSQTPEPSVRASNILFSNVTETSMTLTWTNGNGASRIILAREATAVANNNPVDGTSYGFNNNILLAQNLGSNKIVYNGSGNSFTLTGLTLNKPYAFAFYEYNGTGTTANYLTTPTFASHYTTGAASEPTVKATSVAFQVASNEGYGVKISWQNGNGQGRIVVVREGQTPAADYVIDGTTYTSNNNFSIATVIGPNRVVYNGNGNSVILKGIDPAKTYGIGIYEYNGVGDPVNYMSTYTGGTILVYNQQLILDNLAFQYQYDARRRMTGKKVPGAGWVYMIYDNRDRLVLTQDANQRTGSTHYWSFTKYDELNRPILTGIKDTTIVSQREMQAVVDNHYAKAWARYGETYVGNIPGNLHGYSNKSYPVITSLTTPFISADHYLSAIYYDNYTFRNEYPEGYNYKDEDLSETTSSITYHQPDHEFAHVNGLVTWSKVKVLDGGVRGGRVWLPTVNYYDDRYRLVQSISANTSGGIDWSTSVFDFRGKVIKTKTSHRRVWRDIVGVSVAPTSLSKTHASNSWSAGAASVAELKPGEGGWMQLTVSEINTFRMIGLSDANPNVDFATIDYAFYLFADRLSIRENGIEKKNIVGTIAPNAVLKITRSGTVIRYYKNQVEVYVSDVPSTGKLMVDASLYHNGSALKNIQTSFGDTLTIVKRFEHDHAGRLVKVWHKVDSSPEILLVANSYNELGQLVDKKLHSTVANASDAKQSVDYRYNIRGWLTSINNASVTSDGGQTNDDSGDLFGMELGYNTTLGLPGAIDLQFNGNITSVKWSGMPGASSEGAPQKGYGFGYDPMNRLTKAEYKEKAETWNASGNFNEDGIEYDLNGNILKLSRTQNGPIDQLVYTYGIGSAKSNKLVSVTDAADNEKGFKELLTSAEDYVYDANGNLVFDKNKGGIDILKNGDFTEGDTHWTPTQSIITFENGDLLKTNSTNTAYVEQTNIVAPGQQYVIIIDSEKTSSTGTYSVHVGGTGVNISTGHQVYTVTAGAGNEVRVSFSSGATVIIHKLEVKALSVISYNYLNLPEKVTQGKRNLTYVYDASGRKLSQTVYSATGGMEKKADYSGEFFYENDSLKFIHHEEGRVVMTGATPEYQYHLKDHLGNVRVTFTSKDEVEASTATLETENVSTERSKYVNYDEAVIAKHELFDRTSDGTTNETYHATRLVGGNTNQKYGLARSLSVMPGDEISMEVYAKYLDPAHNWQGEYSAFLAQYISLTPPPGIIIDGGLPGSVGNAMFPFPSFIMPGPKEETVPKAYLNWIVCDRNHQPILGECGFVQIGSTDAPLPKENGSNVQHELLKRATPLKINQPGYVYIYLSNENEDPVEVFFDDFKIEHKKSPVVQMDDYYPFGLAFNSYSRENSINQKYKYNGIEQITDLDLNVYAARYRALDPTIGRWWQIDPKPNHGISMYAAMDNNPIKYSDPLGDTVKFDPGVSKRFITQFNRATTKLTEKGVGGYFNQLQKSQQVYTIKEVKGSKGSYFNAKKNELGWNSKQGMITNSARTLSPATLLNHELDHAAKWDRDPKGFTKDGYSLVAGYGNKEEERVIKGSEQRTATEMGEIGFSEETRTDHFGTLFPMMNSTSTELDESAVITVTGSQDSHKQQKKDDEKE